VSGVTCADARAVVRKVVSGQPARLWVPRGGAHQRAARRDQEARREAGRRSRGGALL